MTLLMLAARRLCMRVGGSRKVGAILWVLTVVVLLGVVSTLHSGAALAEEASPSTRPSRYILQEGDRLIHLAKRFDVAVDAILEANDVDDARELRAGQTLKIPPAGTKASKAQKSRSKTYQVRKGDHLVNIARRYGVSVDDILIANGLSSARQMQAGQELTIPAPGTTPKAPPSSKRESSKRETKSKRSRPEPAWMKRAKKLAKRLGLGSRRTAQKILRGNLEKRWIRAAGKGRMPATLRFPVAGGWTGRAYGSGAGGYHLAIDMPGKIGARVSAAAPGIVAYANNELAGFGKVVIIIHRGGLVTLYAHNSVLKTVPGERVKRGTRVAFLGNTGISRGPHVHFELMYKGQLCDPLPLIRPVARNKAGRPILRKAELKAWPRRGGPPKGIRCGHRRRHPQYVGKPYGWRPPDWPHNNRRKVGGAREGEADPDLEQGSE